MKIGTKYVDHNDKVFASVRDMAEAHGRSSAVVSFRLRSGWSVEDALTTPDGLKEPVRKKVSAGRGRAKVSKDHLNVTYVSKSEMARAWGIPPAVFSQRMNAGWDLESALTTPVNTYMARGAVNLRHLEEEQPKVIGVLKVEPREEEKSVWEMKYHLLVGRLQSGWSLEDALQMPELDKFL